jgi:hypothetical protein
MLKNASIFSIAFFLTVAVFGRGGEGEYAVSKIPDSLLKNANAVLRLEETRYDVKSTKNYVMYYHYVITILNENGDRWSKFSEWYDKLQTIKNVEGSLFDANGILLKKMKWKDLQDLSGTDAISLADDNRIKAHSFYYKTYPYTIEYSEEVEHASTFHFPMWIPQAGEMLSVQKSVMEFMCPEDYKFRYKAFNYKKDPVLSKNKDKLLYTWSVSDLPAIIKEPFQPMLHEITPTVLFGANEFEMGNYSGDISTWNGFGKFQNLLNEGRDILPPVVKQAVHQLTDNISDPKTKISLLYDMLQKNTRYISIQLGIGGWQPFDAAYVATKGYGDCKALSNYMKALLKEAGIKSCYTIIRAGENEKYITRDFPSPQFNHVILCVPLNNDTTWLECTDQNVPAGYLGKFTDDRYCLVVNEDGGSLVHTPKYGIKDNLQIRKTFARLDNENGLSIKTSSQYFNEQQEPYFWLIHLNSKEKLKEELNERLDFATYEINSFEYREEKSAHPLIKETLEIYASNYSVLTGKRLFIIPDLITRNHTKLNPDETRKYDVILNNEYMEIDSVEIELPTGYSLESMPQPVSVKTQFGKYENQVKVTDNKITYYRSFEHDSGRFPPKDYADLVKFYETIYKADRNKVVLVKNQ